MVEAEPRGSPTEALDCAPSADDDVAKDNISDATVPRSLGFILTANT